VSNTPSSRSIPWLRNVALILAAVAVVVAVIVGAFLLTDNAVTPDGVDGSRPNGAVQAPTCPQLVPKAIAIDLGGGTFSATSSSDGQVSAVTSLSGAIATYPSHGYCAIVVSRTPWAASHVSSLPTGSAICVVYDQTPDRATAGDRNVAVLSAGTSFAVDTVHGAFADGVPYVATPSVLIIFVAIDRSTQPSKLPGDILDPLHQIQPKMSIAATSATSPIFGIPNHPDIQSALQVPGWK